MVDNRELVIVQTDNSTDSAPTMKDTRFSRTIPVFVWAVTALHVASLLLGSVFQPLFRVPDERFHADMILAVSREAGWPPPRGRVIGPEIAIASRLLLIRGPLTASNAIPRVASTRDDDNEVCQAFPPPTCLFRPELSDFSDWDVVGNVNRMTQHPPLYYVTVATFVQGVQTLLPPASDLTFDQELWLFRLVSLLMVAPLPLLTYLLAREIFKDRAIQYGATALAVFIPGLHLRNGAMINNDNLLLLLGGLFLVALMRIAKGDTSARLAVMAGALLGLALLTKGFALFLVPTLAVAYILGYVGQHRRGRTVGSGLLSMSVAGVIGGWWWLRNLFLYGRVQPGAGVQVDPAGPTFQPDVLFWFREAAVTFISTFFGGDTFRGPAAEPLLFWTLVTFFAVGLTAAVVLARDMRRHHWLILLPVILLAVGLMFNSYGFYTRTGIVRGEHGRYFYFLLPGLLALLASGHVFASNRLRLFEGRTNLGRFVPPAFLLSAIALQTYSAFRKIQLEWGPPDAALSVRWDALVAWSPLPEPWVPIFLALTVVFAVVALILAMRVALHDESISPAGKHEAAVSVSEIRTRRRDHRSDVSLPGS